MTPPRAKRKGPPEVVWLIFGETGDGYRVCSEAWTAQTRQWWRKRGYEPVKYILAPRGKRGR